MDTREKIINATLDTIKELGYKKSTTKKIAIKAGVNESTIFRIFGNKKELIYTAIYEKTISVDMINTEGLTCGKDIENDLCILLKGYLNAYILQMPIYRLFMIPYIHDQELNQNIYLKIQEFINHLKNYLNQQKENDLIMDLNYQRFSEIVFSKLLAEALNITSNEDDTACYEKKINEFSSYYSKKLAELLVNKI